MDLDDNKSYSKQQENIECGADGQWMLGKQILKHLVCVKKCEFRGKRWEQGQYLKKRPTCHNNNILTNEKRIKSYADDEILCGPDGKWYDGQEIITPDCVW